LEQNDIARKTVLQQFISLAWNLRSLQNYNSLFAIVCGLELACVSRLKNAWKAAFSSSKCESRFRTLVSECSPEANYPKYRAWLRSYEIGTENKFAVPYLGVFLRDLTLCEVGNSAFLTGNNINWERYDLISNQLALVKKFQKFECTIEVNVRVQNFLARGTCSILDDEELYRLSRMREGIATTSRSEGSVLT